MADLYKYYVELELFQFGVIMSQAYHDPKKINRMDPNKVTIDLENVHPMLRPATAKAA